MKPCITKVVASDAAAVAESAASAAASALCNASSFLWKGSSYTNESTKAVLFSVLIVYYSALFKGKVDRISHLRAMRAPSFRRPSLWVGAKVFTRRHERPEIFLKWGVCKIMKLVSGSRWFKGANLSY